MHWDHKRVAPFTLLLCVLLAPHAAIAAGSAVVKETSDVRSSPSAGAKSVAQAPTNEPVEILNRQGAWYEVSSTSGWRGWVRMAAVRMTSLTKKKSNTSLPGFEPAANIGVRGLDEASLKNAQPDYAALTRLRQYRATPQDAASFAAQLTRTEVRK